MGKLQGALTATRLWLDEEEVSVSLGHQAVHQAAVRLCQLHIDKKRDKGNN